MNGPDLEEAPLLTEQDSAEVAWRCEMREGAQTECSNPVEWVGSFACSCVGASCTPHKVHYDREILEHSLFNSIRIKCAKHGEQVVSVDDAVVWSRL